MSHVGTQTAFEASKAQNKTELAWLRFRGKALWVLEFFDKNATHFKDDVFKIFFYNNTAVCS